MNNYNRVCEKCYDVVMPKGLWGYSERVQTEIERSMFEG